MGLVGDDTTVARADARFPERLGEFRLVRRLGGGGMGVVYLAEQEALGRKVALKLVRPEHLYFPGARARFRREVEMVARLQHSGIVPIYSVGEEGGVPYFAMEWIDGCTLADVLKILGGRAPERLTGKDLLEAIREATPEAQAVAPRAATDDGLFGSTWIDASVRLVKRVAEAIEHAHQCGVIHRDVKPSNVLLTAAGRVVLIDFGLAGTEGISGLTRTGDQLGSLPYMSPEHLKGEPGAVSSRADVYGLGVTLYELLALRTPYLSESTEFIRKLILEGRPAPIRSLNRAVPRDIETICLKAIDRDLARRYQSAAALARDLGNVIGKRPIDAKRSSLWLHARRWTQRNPARTAVLVFATLLLASLAVAWAREHAQYLAIRSLSDWQLARQLKSEAAAFWPADPGKLQTMGAWLAAAADLFARLDTHRASLEQLCENAKPYTDEMRKRDMADPLYRRDALVREKESLLTHMGRFPRPESFDEKEIKGLDEEIRNTEREMSLRRTWEYPDAEDQFRHVMLTNLVAELLELHVLIDSVYEQRARVVSLEKQSLRDSAEAWNRAIRDIAESSVYRGLVLKPQLGLVPLWRSPQSGLWEFLHVLTGEAPLPSPTLQDSGHLEITGQSGIVLVLVPGGTFRMGSKMPSDLAPQGGPNVDSYSKSSEQPDHDVSLDAFFISKYETTKDQWSRLDPTAESRDRGPTYPASYVTWNDGRAAFSRVGLDLPSEARWEYACRAGTTSVFFSGNELTSLGGFADTEEAGPANDSSSEKSPFGSLLPNAFGLYAGPRDYGFSKTSPVGTFLPNAFGLYDMHGNLPEWCEDVFVFRAYLTMGHKTGDGLLECVRGGGRRAVRGSCAVLIEGPRSALRSYASPDTHWLIGIRAARSITR